MIDQNKTLILQKNDNNILEDITYKVYRITPDVNKFWVTFNGTKKTYPMSAKKIQMYDVKSSLDIKNKDVYYKGKKKYNVISVLDFGICYKIFYISKHPFLSAKEDLELKENLDCYLKENPYMSYLGDIAKFYATNEENSFLLNQFNNIKLSEESVLYKFLKKEYISTKNTEPIIYPFVTNMSQKKAVKASLENDISVIQGPPGTGKTQTILNIIANYIYQDKTVAVLSGNNEAIRNVYDKLESSSCKGLNAFLGNSDNVTSFFEKEEDTLIDKLQDINISSLTKSLIENEKLLNQTYNYDLALSKVKQLITDYKAEQRNSEIEFKYNIDNVHQRLIYGFKTSQKVLHLLAYIDSIKQKKTFFNELKFLMIYSIIDTQKIYDNISDNINFLRCKYYKLKLKELNKAKEDYEQFLSTHKFKDLKKCEETLSKTIFKSFVTNKKYGTKNFKFDKKTYRKQFIDFVKKYPIVYSTTHSILSCSGDEFLYDVVIVDESSQVDLVTATIAFSCAKKIVIIGDNMQLPHVVKSSDRAQLQIIFNKYNLDSIYDYASNSILDCLLKLENIPTTLLNEHYRCDPEIIGFCNKKFYDDKLIIKSEHTKGQGIKVISHIPHYQRNRSNMREVDIIKKEICQKCSSLAIISPYNDQINLMRKEFHNNDISIDTIHKYQGKEMDNVVLSTVVNDIQDETDFVNNKNLLNVAISRAKKNLYIVTSQNLVEKDNSIISDLVKYCNYNSETPVLTSTKVYSAFDLMYNDYQPQLEKYRKHIKRVSNFDSENIVNTIIYNICKNKLYGDFFYQFEKPLKYILKITQDMDYEDKAFINNINTHCDFVIYNKFDSSVILEIEVDGSQHEAPVQAKRDRRKDRLLTNAGINHLRIKTNEIDVKSKIIEKLKEEVE